MLGGKAHHRAYVEHGKERSHTDDMPLPRAEKGVTGRDAEQYERYIHTNLHLGEIEARNAAHRHGKALAGHRDTSAAHLERDAEAQHRATHRLRQGLLPQADGNEPRGERHADVDKRSEQESYHQLKQLHPFETFAEYQNLPEHQHEVHNIGVLAYRESRHQTLFARALEHVGQHADDAGAQHGAHAHGHAEGHDKQRNQQQEMLPAKGNHFFASAWVRGLGIDFLHNEGKFPAGLASGWAKLRKLRQKGDFLIFAP